MSNSTKRSAQKAHEQMARKKAIADQYGLKASDVKPKPVKHLGVYNFIGERAAKAHQRAARGRKGAELELPTLTEPVSA